MNEETQSTADRAEDEKPPHPIAQTIDRVLHRVRDLEAASRLFVVLAASMQRDMITTAREKLEELEERIADEGKDDEFGPAAAELDEISMCLARLQEANFPNTLLTSFFLGLFSAYDAFTGNLLQTIYTRKPELLETLNVQVPLSELLKHGSFEELKEAVLAEEIEVLRRKSYVEQFEQLESRFGVSLKKFARWPEFIEVGQRRNLITHCDGRVSKQYLKVCRANNVETDAKEGAVLEVTSAYLSEAANVMFEVAIKLGQTLWRKIFPDEWATADEHLTETIYNTLRMENWTRARMLCEFAASQKHAPRDMDRRIRIINYAIALKFGGDEQAAFDLLSKEDWSATLPEFSLAVHVLKGEFNEAKRRMLQIGKKGELVVQTAYHVWPLFRDFRRSEEFLRGYEEIYGTSFASEAVEAANKAKASPAFNTPDMKPKAEERPAFAFPLPTIRSLMG